MKYSQLLPTIQLFKAIACLEDDVRATDDKSDSQDKQSRLAKAAGQFKQLAKEKRALVKRTHQCTLTLMVEYRAKPITITAGEVWSLSIDEQKQVLNVVTCTTDPSDAAVSYPTGIQAYNLEAILEASIANAEQAAMAAVSNAVAENSSQNARDIVTLLGLQDAVKAAQAQTAANGAGGEGPMVLWFPIAGWSSGDGLPYQAGQPFISSFQLPPVMPN